jgi:excisionase family DNA binding protein
MSNLIDVKEAARILKVSVRWVRDLIYNGQLAATKVGRDWVLNREDVEAYRQQQEGKDDGDDAAT